MTPTSNPRLDYLHSQLARCDRRLDDLAHLEKRYPWARLVAFVAWLLGTVGGFEARPSWLGWIALVGLGLVFLVLAAGHRRVLSSQTRFGLLRQIITAQIARTSLDWEHIPPVPAFPPHSNHPFETDLNITGDRSLLRLLDTAASRGGSRLLLEWLLEREPDLPEVLRRQQLVSSLVPKTGFRERLALAGAAAITSSPRGSAASPGDLPPRWEGDPLMAWLDRPSVSASLRWLLVVLGLLALANLVLFVFSALGWIPAYWVIGVLLFWGLQSLKYRETSELFSEAYSLSRSLSQFRDVLSQLETYPYSPDDPLAGLCAPFWQADKRPSRSLRHIGLIVTAASLRGNPFLGLLLNTLLPWDMYFTYRLDQYKQALRGLLPQWLSAWYQLEALSSLATYARNHPDAVVPRLLPAGEAACEQTVFSAKALAHPLIPPSQRVSNDFAIAHLGEIAIITGSNMSGKSTFLRTLGVNLSLAYAGGRVCAAEFCALPFRLFTSIQINDSLNDGISYFYAEVRRLKALLDELNRADAVDPLLFLIDEIFRGTNNQERRIGSQAYTQALAGKNGVGLISTHDLELVRLADTIPGLTNAHFREEIRDGRMAFDYRLRPGPSPTTNALKIMQLEGLPVEVSAPH